MKSAFTAIAAILVSAQAAMAQTAKIDVVENRAVTQEIANHMLICPVTKEQVEYRNTATTCAHHVLRSAKTIATLTREYIGQQGLIRALPNGGRAQDVLDKSCRKLLDGLHGQHQKARTMEEAKEYVGRAAVAIASCHASFERAEKLTNIQYAPDAQKVIYGRMEQLQGLMGLSPTNK